ncbi:TPA: hypothetical protein N0F65_008481 [Lagenidium giganteum]|uniref:DAGKc domain-containing protein n=1 Tax=Lagenidium giganteum TaxID=4803 RepID=A0AAV2Z0H4_9STRA|nr:TPA: hypothetical protein N0F65_008481 [Lagenidium giganteum]
MLVWNECRRRWRAHRRRVAWFLSDPGGIIVALFACSINVACMCAACFLVMDWLKPRTRAWVLVEVAVVCHFALCFWTHYAVMTSNPGTVPPKTSSQKAREFGKSTIGSNSVHTIDMEEDDSGFEEEELEMALVDLEDQMDDGSLLVFCDDCNDYRPSRATHCNTCDDCVVLHDHHCPWINNCIGIGNQKLFLLLLLYVGITSALVLLLVGTCYFSCEGDNCGFQPEMTPGRTGLWLTAGACTFALFCSLIFGLELYNIYLDPVYTIIANQLYGQVGIKSRSRLERHLSVICATNGFEASWLLPLVDLRSRHDIETVLRTPSLAQLSVDFIKMVATTAVHRTEPDNQSQLHDVKHLVGPEPEVDSPTSATSTDSNNNNNNNNNNTDSNENDNAKSDVTPTLAPQSSTSSVRRATTVGTVESRKLQLALEQATQNDAVKHDKDIVLLERSKSLPQRMAAVEAIEQREVRFRFSKAASIRDSVRDMHSHRINEFPEEICRAADAELHVHRGPVWKQVRADIDRDGLHCWRISTFRKRRKEYHLSSDDIIGASELEDGVTVAVHYMRPGRGVNEKRLKRRLRRVLLRFSTRTEAITWVEAIQQLVRWLARVPEGSTRKIKVVVNPHSGKRKGLQIWQRWKPVFEMAGIVCDMEETRYGGHATDIGKTFDLSRKYEALVFIGGDGTVNEFMNGVFARDEREWRNVVATTPLSLLCAGTDNAFGVGVGTPTHESAVYCIIKCKIRPLDVLSCATTLSDGTQHRDFSCCGVSYGLGADIAMESEQTRWLGVHRYAWLKVKRGALAPRRHECRIKYVLSDDVEIDPATNEQVLRTYYEIADRDCEDQHHIEMCSVYDDSYSHKLWQGDATSIFDPCSETKYGDKWLSENGAYTTIGASNVYFETEYAHPSDGNMDLVIVRKGKLGKTIDVGIKYLCGNYLSSSLIDYFKIKALVIQQGNEDPINVDGEVFPGPGPFRIEVIPNLLCVLSEK